MSNTISTLVGIKLAAHELWEKTFTFCVVRVCGFLNGGIYWPYRCFALGTFSPE